MPLSSSYRTPLRTKATEWIAMGLLVVSIAGGWSLAGEDLIFELNREIKTNTTDKFETAKKHLFNVIEKLPDNTVLCVYSGTKVSLARDTDNNFKPDPKAGVDVEHTWACRAKWAATDYHFNREKSVQGADLHNLYATRKGINRSRGDHPFGELPPNARELRVNDNGTLNDEGEGIASGSFRGKNDEGIIIFEPRDDHKGNVARTMFYMSVRYLMPIPEYMEKDLRQWDASDPVDQAELDRNDRIENIQSNRNPFIDDTSLVDLIGDF